MVLTTPPPHHGSQTTADTCVIAIRTPCRSVTSPAGVADLVTPVRTAVSELIAEGQRARVFATDLPATAFSDARAEVSVQQITAASGVGLGSFCYHFGFEEELFEAAVLATLEEHAAAVAALTRGLADPAERFAAGVRLTGRLGRSRPVLSGVLVNSGLRYVTSSPGLGALALADLSRGRDAGGLTLTDPELMLAVTGGVVLGLLQHLDTHPEVESGDAADELARALLQMCGLGAREADAVVGLPLPAPVPPVREATG
jgi:AcrR family transcriptional regulator